MELFRCPGTIPLSCHQWTMVTRLLLSLFPSNEESLIWSVAIICCHETDVGSLTSVSRNGNARFSPNCCHDTDVAVYRCVSWQTQDVMLCSYEIVEISGGLFPLRPLSGKLGSISVLVKFCEENLTGTELFCTRSRWLEGSGDILPVKVH